MKQALKATAVIIGIVAAGGYLIKLAISAALHAFLFILTI